MDPTTQPRRHRLLVALVAGGLVLLTLIGVGIYGLLRGPGDSTSPADTPKASTSPTPTPPPAIGVGPQPVPTSGGSEAFAQAVAYALFTWDTTSGYTPVDYAQPLSDVASTAEANALASDVRAYLPSEAAWAQLLQYQTRQWLTTTETVVPTAWETALAQAAPGQIPAGTTAYTITGTRHRAGVWQTTPTDAERAVSFTVFVTCLPPIPDRGVLETCELLRLSELDNPLR